MTDTPQPDFIAHIHGEWATCWSIEAVSASAKEFARDHFDVPDWSGDPERFTTDWRPARNLCAALHEEGFVVCCTQTGRPGLGVWRGE